MCLCAFLPRVPRASCNMESDDCEDEKVGEAMPPSVDEWLCLDSVSWNSGHAYQQVLHVCLQAIFQILKKLDLKPMMLTNMVVKLGEVLNEVSRALCQQCCT